MSASFNKIVGIAGISVLLQFAVKAQNPVASQTQSPRTSASSGSASSKTYNNHNPELNSQVALVSDKATEKASEKALEKTSSKVVSEVKTGTKVDLTIEAPKTSTAIAQPKISLKNPSIQFKVKLNESKLNGLAFAEPDLELPIAAPSFQATAYALQGRTRSGVYVRRGVIAADPRVIPLGSVVQIKTPGYSGVYTVHDTGKRIKGKMIDVWVGTPREARMFGRRQIKLHVLRLGPKGSSAK